MSFFYDLNKKLDGIRATPEVTHKQLNERDMGKHNNATTGFKALADKTNDKIAGAQFQKMKKAGQLEEGPLDAVKKIGKKVASGVNKLVGHGSDEDMIRDLQRKSGAPVTGKKPVPPQQVKEKLSPAKQKSFAALAPPTDKITFADKIAGAKKEVDEMLGDVAAEAMRKALGGGKGRNAEMDEGSEENAFTAHKRPSPVQPKVGSTERGHKHDIKHTATGRMVTRRTDDQGNSVGADDDGSASGEKRGRGRPKGTKGSIGAKGPSGKSKLITREGDVSTGHLQQMWQLVTTLKAYVQDPEGQALLKELTGMVKHYMNQGKEAPVEEEKTSTRDAHAEKAGKKVTKDIEHDEENEDGITGKKRGPEDDKAEKAGKKVTKDIEHDEKKKKKDEEVDESTTSGSVATSTATTSSKGGVYGKGIYDSMNRELEKMISESMSINMSDSTEGGKSLTITATDEDALKLGMLLKNAGLGGGDSHGGCDDVQEAVDENAPDWPTNTEQADSNFGYSGGLDGPKSTGQSIVPVLASQDDRQHSYAAEEEDAIKRMMEMAGLAQANLTPGKHTMQAMGPEMSYSDSDPEKIKYDNWLRKASDKDLWDEASKYESVPDYIGREFEKLVAQQKELLGPAAYREKGINDRLKSKLKKYPNMSAPMKEEEEVEEDTVDESIQRMREMAGIREAKKTVDEEKTEEGNLFTKGLEDDDVKIGDKIPGTNAIKKKDIDESIFALTNQWRAYKG